MRSVPCDRDRHEGRSRVEREPRGAQLRPRLAVAVAGSLREDEQHGRRRAAGAWPPRRPRCPARRARTGNPPPSAIARPSSGTRNSSYLAIARKRRPSSETPTASVSMYERCIGASTTPPSLRDVLEPRRAQAEDAAQEQRARAAHEVVEPGAVARERERFRARSPSAGVDAILERVRIGPGTRLGARDGVCDRVLDVALERRAAPRPRAPRARASRPRSDAPGPARPSRRTARAGRTPHRRARRGPPCAASSARAPSGRRPSARARSPRAPRDRRRARRCRRPRTPSKP